MAKVLSNVQGVMITSNLIWGTLSPNWFVWCVFDQKSFPFRGKAWWSPRCQQSPAKMRQPWRTKNSTAAQTGDSLWVDKVCVSRLSCDGGVGAAVVISVTGLFDSMPAAMPCMYWPLHVFQGLPVWTGKIAGFTTGAVPCNSTSSTFLGPSCFQNGGPLRAKAERWHPKNCITMHPRIPTLQNVNHGWFTRSSTRIPSLPPLHGKTAFSILCQKRKARKPLIPPSSYLNLFFQCDFSQGPWSTSCHICLPMIVDLVLQIGGLRTFFCKCYQVILVIPWFS